MMALWLVGAWFMLGLCASDEKECGAWHVVFCIAVTVLVWPYLLGVAVREMYNKRNEVAV